MAHAPIRLSQTWIPARRRSETQIRQSHASTKPSAHIDKHFDRVCVDLHVLPVSKIYPSEEGPERTLEAPNIPIV